MHLADPVAVLTRLADSPRPGGLLLAEEGDYGMYHYGNHPDAEELTVSAHEAFEAMTRAGIMNMYFGRRLPALVATCGLELCGAEVDTAVAGPGDPPTSSRVLRAPLAAPADRRGRHAGGQRWTPGRLLRPGGDRHHLPQPRGCVGATAAVAAWGGRRRCSRRVGACRSMAALDHDLDGVLVGELELWQEGAPNELFAQLRRQCPVHWTERISGEVPDKAGFWSVTTAEDVHTVSRDWQTYSSELGGISATNSLLPLELTRSMFIGMDPPQHDRVKALFQAGFTPKRIAAHEDDIRSIVTGVLDRLDGQQSCDLVSDVAQPVVSRVIGSFMGIPPDEDDVWARLINAMMATADRDLNPDGIEQGATRNTAELFERCGKLIAERRARPTDDLTSVLVHAEVDGQRLQEHEIVMGFFLLMAAGNDSTKATYCSGMRALIENPDQRQLLLDDPALIPGAVEESLRMFPAFSHFRRTATCDTELHGQHVKAGDKVVMWYVSSNRDETVFEDPDRFDVRRWPKRGCPPEAASPGLGPSTRRSARAGGTSAWERRLPVSSCASSLRRRSRATPRWRSQAPPRWSSRSS